MATELQQLSTGKYLFFGKPVQQEGQNVMVAGFSAKAIGIPNNKLGVAASIQEYDISLLISKRSTHLIEEKLIEAHKLYTWPANLGDPKAWASSKYLFFEQHLINQAIEVLKVSEDHQITWKFIPLSFFQTAVKEAQAVTLLFSIFPEL
ncbi:hypothetical protein AQ505_14500 [Pedobacter sp. PACM 27299]|uniref:hypothetical protein n=1 Tax=Pedobacter sp. PACM 27299 TaxID=1727164 RepID=UPI0007059A45|nr:hypothetical protein [Pedobacter sp. PACM 27299]ALL06599.1 hypothetical protein AQ505_14500 [Pedobacter sp. PACM 27299]